MCTWIQMIHNDTIILCILFMSCLFKFHPGYHLMMKENRLAIR